MTLSQPEAQCACSIVSASRIKYCAGGGEQQQLAFTASAWRMLRWACDYAALLRPMRAQAARVLAGVAELFELYLVHTFHTFAEVGHSLLACPGFVSLTVWPEPG